MKMTNLKNSIPLLLAAVAMVLSGCSDGSDEKNGGALVTSISVAGVSVTPVPSAVSRADWTGADFSLFDLGPDQLGEVVIGQASALTNAQIAVTASAGAKVKYAAAELDVPQSFQDSSTITLINNGYLVLQVTSEDGKAVNYYVVSISLANTLTSLTQVTVGGITASLGTQNAAWDQAGVGTVGLSNATKTNAAIAITKANVNQTVKYAKVTGAGAPSFGDTATFTFADGDFLYIEVTAANGINKGVYKLEVQIGRDTTLSALTIGGASVINLGTPAATLAGATAGTFLSSALQDVGGFAVSVTPTDAEAVAQWAAVSTDTNTATFATTSPIVFTDGGYLYIKVQSANNANTAFYKVRVDLMQTATIKYGQPEIKASSEKYIDPVWNSVTETYTIAKIFPSDSSADYTANPTTTGVAKALFDGNGLYVYVEVTDPAVDSSGSSTYTQDSVELFINEGVDANGALSKDPVSYLTKGGQYRVGADGTISADPAEAAMSADKVSAWTTDTGYVVIFQAPWRFADQYPVANNKKIGFELQINACSNGSRDGVMVWNNIAHTNYQNVTDYGEATLDLDGHTLAVNAKNPTISTHPTSAVYTGSETATALSVTAASVDSGTLTYQWYSNTANSYENGTAIDGQTTASYTPNIATDGTTYYWVTVTNTITDNSDGGTKTAALPSGIASIVVSSVPLVEKIEAGASSLPVYRFTPPEGSTWSDYKTITFTVMVADQTSYDEAATRAYIGGSYQSSTFSAGVFSKLSNWNDSRLVKISDGATLSSLLGSPGLYTWKDLSYPVVEADVPADQKDTSYAKDTYYPADNAAGPFFFALGFTVNPNSGSGRTVTYYIKDVALVKADGTTKLPADDLATTDGGASLGQFRVIFSNDAGAKVIRTLEAEPSAE
jgi:hypothetical protein